MVNNLINKVVLSALVINLGKYSFRYLIGRVSLYNSVHEFDVVLTCIQEWILVGLPNVLAIFLLLSLDCPTDRLFSFLQPVVKSP